MGWLDDDEDMVISSCIINLAAHYRLFFQSNYNTSTRIFLYFGNQAPRNQTSYMPDYGHKFFGKYGDNNAEYYTTNTAIARNLKLCEIIVPYITGVYYIPTGNVEPVVAASYMMVKYPNTPDLVITKDEHWFQLVNVDRDVNILRLQRDESCLICQDNVYDYLLGRNTFRPSYVPPEMLSTVSTFAGVKSRDITGLQGYGFAKSLKLLDSAINRNLIAPKRTNIRNILDDIYNGPDQELLINTFKAIDLQFQLNELTLAQKEALSDNIRDRYNRKDLIDLNNQYYTGEDSLMLEELSRGINRIDTFSW
jgi:hypothetical protein